MWRDIIAHVRNSWKKNHNEVTVQFQGIEKSSFLTIERNYCVMNTAKNKTKVPRHSYNLLCLHLWLPSYY